MLKNLAMVFVVIATMFALASWIEFLLIEKLTEQAAFTERNTSMWAYHGWDEAMYPTENSMREAFR